MILNFFEETKDIKTISRYNGGWLRRVTGLDKSKNTGASILGETVHAGNYESNYEEGLYIDCSKDGSRKNQEWTYHLFRFSKDGVELLKTLENAGPIWAVGFWEIIETELKNTEDKTQAILNKIYEESTDEETLLKVVLQLLDNVTKTGDCLEIAKRMLTKVDVKANNLFEEVDLKDIIETITPQNLLREFKHNDLFFDENMSKKCQAIAKAYLRFKDIDDEYDHVYDYASTFSDVLIYNLQHEDKYDYVNTYFGEYFVKINNNEVVVVDFRYDYL